MERGPSGPSVSLHTFDRLMTDHGTLYCSDEDIVHALTNSTDWVAGAFKARGQ